MESHKLSLNLKEYPQLAAELAGASAGDTVTFKEVEVMIDEISEDTLVASIKECEGLSVKEGPNREEKDEEMEEDTEKVLSVMAPGYKKK